MEKTSIKELLAQYDDLKEKNESENLAWKIRIKENYIKKTLIDVLNDPRSDFGWGAFILFFIPFGFVYMCFFRPIKKLIYSFQLNKIKQKKDANQKVMDEIKKKIQNLLANKTPFYKEAIDKMLINIIEDLGEEGVCEKQKKYLTRKRASVKLTSEGVFLGKELLVEERLIGAPLHRDEISKESTQYLFKSYGLETMEESLLKFLIPRFLLDCIEKLNNYAKSHYKYYLIKINDCKNEFIFKNGEKILNDINYFHKDTTCFNHAYLISIEYESKDYDLNSW